MSRSYKRKPITKDKNKGMKSLANRKVRKQFDIPNGKSYKKCFQSYDICDWFVEHSFEEELKEYYSEKQAFLNGGNMYFIEKTYKELYRNWLIRYKNK